MSKPLKTADKKEIVYTEGHWKLLDKFRRSAERILGALEALDIGALVYGSVARGDVDEDSDVDVVVPRIVPSYKVEWALGVSGFKFVEREIVMATPWQLPKAHISLGDNRTVSFPLVEPKLLEAEFYRFGGAADLDQIKSEKRVPGVDKRLIFVEPTERGHRESQVVGREAEVAKKLGTGLQIVRERIQVLTRRDRLGRTGIFLQRKLSSKENFEAVFKGIAESNPEVKRRVKDK